MARLPRLVLPGQAHLVIQPALVGQTPFRDAEDRADYLRLLRDTVASHAVALHAWALLPSELQLLITPATPDALGGLIQAVGRRHVSAHNRRHGRRGTVWAGRFGSAALEPGLFTLLALRFVDGQAAALQTSAGQRLGREHEAGLSDPAEYWALGNTPFDREAAYRELLRGGISVAMESALRRAAAGGWPLGSAPFLARAHALGRRPVQPRPRGRPPQTATR